MSPFSSGFRVMGMSNRPRREINHRCKRNFTVFLTLLLASLSLLCGNASAASYTVTNTADTGPGSLRQAIAETNATTADDTINFTIPATDPGCSDGVCTITLASGELIVAAKATAGALTITNPKPEDLVISGNNASRVFNNQGDLVLSGVTISGGKATDSYGGGIAHQGQQMTLTNSILTGSQANIGGGVYCDQTTMTISNTTFTGNVATSGAAFFTLRGNIEITNCIITANTAVPPSPQSASIGGGVTNDEGIVSITDSTISGNSSVFSAGGVENLGGITKIVRCLISGNTVTNANPQVFTFGGGIATEQKNNISARLSVFNSTISGNTAGRAGGGICVSGRGSVLIVNSTLTDNDTVLTGTFGGGGGLFTSSDANDVRLLNTIIAGNSSGTGTGPDVQTVGSTSLSSLGNNIIGNTDGGPATWAPSDKLNLNPQIDPLSENGGPTQTHALLANSPAINMGNNCVATDSCAGTGMIDPLTNDQRGGARPASAANAVDIGAFEFGASAPPNPNLPPIPLLWAAGRDLASNEKPNNSKEGTATNAKVPQWSYGYRATATGTDLTLFSAAEHTNAASGIEGWIGAGQRTLAVNTTGAPIVFNTGSGDFKPILPRQMYLNPSGANDFIVVRWTAPEDGDYRFFGKWLDLDEHGGDGAAAHFVVNGVEQFKEEWADGGSARLRAKTLPIKKGDLVDFVLGSKGEASFDETAFNAAIRRVPHVEFTSPAGGSTFTEGQPITFTVNAAHADTLRNVSLRVEGETVATDTTPPYEFTLSDLEANSHYIFAVATDAKGVKGTSQVLKIRVNRASQNSPAAKGQETASQIKAASTGKAYFCVNGGGYWQNENTWNPKGVPDVDDSVTIPADCVVLLSRNEAIKDIELLGKLQLAPGAPTDTLTVVTGLLSITGGEIKGPFTLVIGRRGKVFVNQTNAILTDVTLDNDGKITLIGGGWVTERSSLTNRGNIELGPLPGTQAAVALQLASFQQNGGRTGILPGASVEAARVKIAGGVVALSPGSSPLVGLDGSTLIGNDGSTLIGNDGSTLKGPDGAPLIGNDGSTLIGNDGSTRPAPILGRAGAEPNGEPAAGIELSGGIVVGTGELRGNVTNTGAFILPGESAGGILVNGDYTQESAATLLLELGGTTTDPMTYDIFQVTGNAQLGGKLIVRSLGGFASTPGDDLMPLRYGSHTGAFDSVTSNAQIVFGDSGAEVNVSGPNPPAPKALNISTRARVETGANVLIGGFIITGSEPKKVIIRAIGPSLTPLGVPGALANPTLSLHSTTALLTNNDDWRSSQEQEIIASHLAPENDLESVIIATLAPGAYTAIVSGSGNGTGVALVEVYEANSATPNELANIATRGFVQTGDNVMIGGFIIGGDYPAKVLVRAIGPSLAVSGVPNPLLDPVLELVDANGNIVSNDNWRATQEEEIIATTLPPNSDREAAILATLIPGNYTAIVRGKDDTTGVALIEAYMVP